MMQPLCKKLCLPTLANLLGTVAADGSSPAIDYLQEVLVGESREAQLADVLLLYARDGSVGRCPNGHATHLGGDVALHDGVPVMVCRHCKYTFTADGWWARSLIRVDFPQSTLCRWLEAVGEGERAKDASAFVIDAQGRTHRGHWCGALASRPDLDAVSPPKRWDAEPEARLDLKRRVLELFPDVRIVRSIRLPHKGIAGRLLSDVLRPHGFLVDDPELYSRIEATAPVMFGTTEFRQTLKPVDFLPPESAPATQWSNNRIDIRQTLREAQDLIMRSLGIPPDLANVANSGIDSQRSYVVGRADTTYAGQPLGRTDRPTIEPRE